MKKTIAALAALAALGIAAAPAGAASAVKYKGKTNTGLPITFTLKGKKVIDMNSGIRVSCLSIQGGGAPVSGADTFSYKGYVPLSAKPQDFTFMKKGAFGYTEVTTKHTLTSKLNRRTKVITGNQRIQYSYLVPKYIPGTFSIYSCLGAGKFTAKQIKR